LSIKEFHEGADLGSRGSGKLVLKAKKIQYFLAEVMADHRIIAYTVRSVERA